MTGLIERKNHIAASGKFDGKAVLRFAGVDVSVDSQDARRRIIMGRGGWYIQQPTHDHPIRAGKTDITDRYDPSVRLCAMGQKAAEQNQKQGSHQIGGWP